MEARSAPAAVGNGKASRTPLQDYIELNVELTPAKAQELLALNTYDIQRNVRPPWVEEFRREMVAGRFERGTVIAVLHLRGTTEVLLGDAQHRLLARIAAGDIEARVLMDIRHFVCDSQEEM